ncbi:unnamed protein product [Clavelina lepadiformis]|uniref:Band 7 domain-containing protein n=1 Tax=Clavelina lepadiformis TaxID=159417 RepID=A0ABP0FKP5_CLALP
MAEEQRDGRVVDSETVEEVSMYGNEFICCFLPLLLSILAWPPLLFTCVKVVSEYERAVFFQLGRLVGKAKGPGVYFVNPCLHEVRVIDMRTKTFDVPPQEILTLDSVTVAIDAVVYYRVKNAMLAISNVENVDGATLLQAQTTLRNILASKSLTAILSEREELSNAMLAILDRETDPWGIAVERVEIKNVKLPRQLQRSMAAEAEATRGARAKVISADGEKNAAVQLKKAAEIMDSAPNTIQLRLMQTLNTISAQKNETIIIPLPVDLIQQYLNK